MGGKPSITDTRIIRLARALTSEDDAPSQQTIELLSTVVALLEDGDERRAQLLDRMLVELVQAAEETGPLAEPLEIIEAARAIRRRPH
ncbi:MAG: hypothetical protein Q8Q88_23905 [Phenylobacterium sp.]|uniref:hypothetical protein n=1 Tax=Phenylobacterium sp. TaxID=1871053 RepID=UPI002732ABCF|nr:hypothetical protein [Phenylobacterium sp.]MDP3750081.1 hypothetical protein [Phenylobacterium sp.]